MLISFAFLSCEGPYIFNRVVKKADGDKMLLGGVDREVFAKEPFSTWFFTEYDSYQPNEAMVKDFKSKIKKYRIEVFLGSWDDASKKEYPRLLKILDAAKFPTKRITTYAVNENLKSFYGEEGGKDIQHLPTIIFYRGGDEIGRIVESPVSGSLEEDILMIVNGVPLTPNYFED